MTDSNQQPRALAPRKLEQQETLQSLNQWKIVFRNYFRRCQFYGFFLQPNVTWNNEVNRGFVANEPNGLKRTPAVLAADLDGLLECLGSFLPFDYVVDKLKKETTDMKSAWAIIYEIYDAEICTTHYLDYALMSKLPQETYRSYFNRLVGFVQQHLPDKRYVAEGVTSPIAGEELTIGLLDSVAVHWLLTIDKRLNNIVKTEFATELKTKRLCQMVKQIATNVDELLQRYANQDTVNSVTSRHQAPSVQAAYSLSQTDDSAIDMIISRLERLERGNESKWNPNFKKKRGRSKGNCIHCSLINKQLGSNLNTKHNSKNCVKKKLSVSVIETAEMESSTNMDESDSNEGAQTLPKTKLINSSLQNSSKQQPRNSGSDCETIKLICCANNVSSQPHNELCVTNNELSELNTSTESHFQPPIAVLPPTADQEGVSVINNQNASRRL